LGFLEEGTLLGYLLLATELLVGLGREKVRGGRREEERRSEEGGRRKEEGRGNVKEKVYMKEVRCVWKTDERGGRRGNICRRVEKCIPTYKLIQPSKEESVIHRYDCKNTCIHTNANHHTHLHTHLHLHIQPAV
jgi:hypothetical protein